MPTKLITKFSTTAGTKPTSGQLDVGELGVNLADKELYSKDNGGTIVKLTNQTGITTITDFGMVADGSTNDLVAFKAMNVAAEAAALGLAVYVPDNSIIALDASGDSDKIDWSNKLTLYGNPRSFGEKSMPTILINHANTYFFTEDATISDAKEANFGFQNMEIKGYNASTTNRWDDNTSGGERNVVKLWEIKDAQIAVVGRARNAVTLFDIKSTRAGNFPEQIKVHGRVSDYTNAFSLSKEANGTGSFEHGDFDLIITQGKKAGVSDNLFNITAGASLYRSEVKCVGRADNDGTGGALFKVDGSGSTFSNNDIKVQLDRMTNNNFFTLTNGGAALRNTGLINGIDGGLSVDGTSEFGQNAIVTVGLTGGEIRGTAAPSAFNNTPSYLVSSLEAQRPINTTYVNVTKSGSLPQNATVGIVPAYTLGDSTNFSSYRVTAVQYVVGTAGSGNTLGGWDMGFVRSSGSGGTSPTFRIPDGSTSGVVHLDTTSALLANYAFPDAWFETPIKVVSRAAAGSINDGSAPSNAYFILTLAELT